MTFSNNPGPVEVLLRCDAGMRHGLGHLSRCITLGLALRECGFEPRLVLHAPEALLERVKSAGLSVRGVNADVGSDTPIEWISAVNDMAKVVVIDSKLATAEYVRVCRMAGLVVCFDDEKARNLPCDLLINNNIWATPDDYSGLDRSILALGPIFNTVNPLYFKPACQKRNGLLITLGGEDPYNHTEWLVRVLADDLGDLPVHICVGPAHPDPVSLTQTCNRIRPTATIHYSPPSLTALTESCHLAISAGGTTCYELAAAGVAIAILVSEEHQQRLASSMVTAGAALLLGSHDDLDAADVRRGFIRLRDPAVSSVLAISGRRLFPAPGGERLAKEIATRFDQYNLSISC